MFRLADSVAHRALADFFPEYFSTERGTALRRIARAQPGFEVRRGGDYLQISCASDADFYRALGELLRDPAALTVRGLAAFETRGLMLDTSRNGVPTLAALQQWILLLALLGYNQLTLYTEDTYAVPGHPLIGHLRGAYSVAELREIRKFAAAFGIEMFPCIQTLGHVEQILQYRPEYDHVRDTSSVLNVNAPETLAFIRELLESAQKPYTSRLVHLGMDEPWDLGRGQSFVWGQKVEPRELYLKHIRNVVGLCRRAELKPIIWGDVIIGQHPDQGEVPLTPKQAAQLPRDLTINYWNYFDDDPAIYAKHLEIYLDFGFTPMVSPGLWSWDRFYALYGRYCQTAEPLLQVAKRKNLRQALLTLWGDDGQECSVRSTLPGIVHFAEHCWHKSPKTSAIDATLSVLGKASLEDFVRPSLLDAKDAKAVRGGGNFAKALLWDDPLLRLFASHLDTKDYGAFYATLAQEFATEADRPHPHNAALFEFVRDLASALAVKAELGRRAAHAYKTKNRAGLKRSLVDAELAHERCKTLWQAHRKLWLSEFKPFGLEVLDARYGAVLLRLEVFQERIRSYLAGSMSEIAEFETRNLKFLGAYPFHKRRYRGTATPAYNRWGDR